MTLTQFLQELKDRGYTTREEAEAAVLKWKNAGNEFEEEKPADVPATLGEQGRAAMDEWKKENPRSLTNVAKNIGGMAKGLGTEVVKAVNPIEAGKALGGYVAHPIESLKGSIKGLGQAGVGLVNAVPGAIQLISGVKNIEPVVTPPQWMQPSNPIQERTARYANLATMALPVPSKINIGTPIKNLGVKIEQSLIGKGNKSLLKKQNITSRQAATNALESNVGGTLKQHIDKIDNVLEKVEDNIDESIVRAEAAGLKKTINMDNVLDKVEKRINSGTDETFFGQTDEALNAFDFWKKELGRYNYYGDLPLSATQKAKRLLGKKGFKKGAMPSENTIAKENVADVINLELKDELESAIPEIHDLNQVYKKLLPVKQMAENRLPVAGSNDLMGLARIAVGGLFKNLGTLGLYEASKSGVTAQGLYNVGKGINKIPYNKIYRSQIVPGTIMAPSMGSDTASVPLSEIARPRKR